MQTPASSGGAPLDAFTATVTGDDPPTLFSVYPDNDKPFQRYGENSAVVMEFSATVVAGHGRITFAGL